MVILGVDPGLATMGYGVIQTNGNQHKVLTYGVLTTPPKVPMHTRLLSLFTGVDQLMSLWTPDEVAVEELFFSKNVTTGIAVGQARGAALAAVARKCEDVYEYTPMQVKLAITGYGKADKKQMQQMIKMLLNLTEIPKPDDAADALAIAVCHGNMNRQRALYKIR